MTPGKFLVIVCILAALIGMIVFIVKDSDLMGKPNVAFYMGYEEGPTATPSAIPPRDSRWE